MKLKDVKVEPDDEFDRNFERKGLTPPRAEAGHRITQIMVREGTKLGEVVFHFFLDKKVEQKIKDKQMAPPVYSHSYYFVLELMNASICPAGAVVCPLLNPPPKGRRTCFLKHLVFD